MLRHPGQGLTGGVLLAGHVGGGGGELQHGGVAVVGPADGILAQAGDVEDGTAVGLALRDVHRGIDVQQVGG